MKTGNLTIYVTYAYATFGGAILALFGFFILEGYLRKCSKKTPLGLGVYGRFFEFKKTSSASRSKKNQKRAAIENPEKLQKRKVSAKTEAQATLATYPYPHLYFFLSIFNKEAVLKLAGTGRIGRYPRSFRPNVPNFKQSTSRQVINAALSGIYEK